MKKYSRNIVNGIIANIATVLRNSFTASSFLPSRYSLRGWKQNRYPMTAAERVKRERTSTGVTRDSGYSFVSRSEIEFMANTIVKMYIIAARAL